jgi:signal transduction histidine kinase
MELASGQLTIMGNITQIEQVLMNLAGNANDAMPYGGSLTISTGTMEINGQFIKEHGFGRHGRFASVTVTDTGFGIDEDVMKKIFEPFFTTKPVGKGTGLGLSVVYSIVKQHKGYIDVHSELGKGTTFNIYLPLTENMPGN